MCDPLSTYRTPLPLPLVRFSVLCIRSPPVRPYGSAAFLRRVMLKNTSITCNDGTTAGYYLRLSSSGSKRWLGKLLRATTSDKNSNDVVVFCLTLIFILILLCARSFSRRRLALFQCSVVPSTVAANAQSDDFCTLAGNAQW